MKIAFQGIKGAYSELALKKYFGDNVESVGFARFDEVFEAVENSIVDCGFIPAENTIAGTIVENYDLLFEKDLHVTEEAFMRICHTLLAQRDVQLKDINEVYSHPHALNQCKKFLKKHNILATPFYDTAGAALMVSNKKSHDRGAIASKICAKIYDLKVLKEDIQTNTTNTTRFFVIRRKNKEKKNSKYSFYEKTSLAFKTKHKPGALVDCLKIFQDYSLNLSKLESRPVPENPWEYIFYAAIEHVDRSAHVLPALEELKEQALIVKVLGSYKKGKIV